uniref:Uncharacterized protein n=1 Tax=Megaselia scalaris TaxID=36166 RepID=T1GGA1_MEGSC
MSFVDAKSNRIRHFFDGQKLVYYFGWFSSNDINVICLCKYLSRFVVDYLSSLILCSIFFFSGVFLKIDIAFVQLPDGSTCNG